MMALAAMQRMKMPIWTFQRHLARLLYTRHRHGSRNCRGVVIRSAFRFRLSEMSEMGVRRAKAALSSGCKSHPATAPAESNRSGNEVAEAFD
jgi:hypothetical protein